MQKHQNQISPPQPMVSSLENEKPEFKALFNRLLFCIDNNCEFNFENIHFKPALKRLLTSTVFYEDGPEVESLKSEIIPFADPFPPEAQAVRQPEHQQTVLYPGPLDLPDNGRISPRTFKFRFEDQKRTPHNSYHLRPTPSFAGITSFSWVLGPFLIQLFTQERVYSFTGLNLFDYKIISSIISKITGERVIIKDRRTLRRNWRKIQKIQRPERQLREQYKKYAFKTCIFIMKMKWEYLDNQRMLKPISSDGFDKVFYDFLNKNFARKNQRLDHFDFERRFYQNMFQDSLLQNPNARITDFVCPTSSRPSMDHQRRNKDNETFAELNKLPSRFCTINAQYFQTVFSNRKFKRLFIDVLDNYFDQFVFYQIKNKFETLIASWRSLFQRNKGMTTPLDILHRVVAQVRETKIKLAWPIHKVRVAKEILKKEYKATMRRIRL